MTDRYVYSPFGEQNLVADDPDVNRPSGKPFRFTGRRFDAESGLYYYRARYYDSELGRFLQTDPVGYADQMNMYAYTHNDPLNHTDPTGRIGEWIDPQGITSPLNHGVIDKETHDIARKGELDGMTQGAVAAVSTLVPGGVAAQAADKTVKVVRGVRAARILKNAKKVKVNVDRARKNQKQVQVTDKKDVTTFINA